MLNAPNEVDHVWHVSYLRPTVYGLTNPRPGRNARRTQRVKIVREDADRRRLIDGLEQTVVHSG